MDEEKIIDVDDRQEDSSPVVYDINSYGVDYDVDGLVKRLNRGDIYIPPFQRDYVWNQAEASRLVESLLLGLPVPGVFLAKDTVSNKLSVIDGQQRLKTLQYFYNGFFNPKIDDNRKKIFKLIKVQEKFEGRTYEKLEEEDRIKLDDSIIHATIVKQESPSEDNTSIYHVFERLNTGGRKLTPQEIRSAIYIGKLNILIGELNEDENWRELYGKRSIRLKDQEMILRFFAMYFNIENYAKPLKEFLNKFNNKYRNPTDDTIEKMKSIFKSTVLKINTTFGPSAFRPDRVFNAAAFETLMTGIANYPELNLEKLKKSIGKLYKKPEFIETITRATSDDKIVKSRHEIFKKFIKEHVQ